MLSRVSLLLLEKDGFSPQVAVDFQFSSLYVQDLRNEKEAIYGEGADMT